MSDLEKQQQRVKEFMSLLPLTIELAGLPKSEHGRYYTQDQIEARLITFRYAYKSARAIINEVAQG
jgi:hypothetical protein